MRSIAVEEPDFECKFNGLVKIISSPSMVFKLNGKGAYRGPMTVLVTRSSAGGAAANATGIGVILPTVIKGGQNDEMGYIREGDKGYIIVRGTTPMLAPTVGIEVVTVRSSKQRMLRV